MIARERDGALIAEAWRTAEQSLTIPTLGK